MLLELFICVSVVFSFRFSGLLLMLFGYWDLLMQIYWGSEGVTAPYRQDGRRITSGCNKWRLYVCR